MSDAPPQAIAPRANNPLRRVVVIGTVLSLATAYGWMASFDRQSGGQMAFHWSGATLLWSAIGVASSIYFWRKIWPPGDRQRATRKEIIIGSVVLLLPSLWWLTSPLRFLSGQNFRDVASGLVAAALILCFGAWMVILLIKAFERSDKQDLVEQETAEPGAQSMESSKHDGSSGPLE